MELRRLIKFGSSSFVVSLPKNWVDKNNLSKGDFLYFNENGNNELIIAPRDAEKKKKISKITIDITNKPLDTVRREIMSAYIKNNDMINIVGDLKPIRQPIDNMLHGLLALEIMEDTPDRIVIRDFLNVSDISLGDVIRRMDVMVKVMLGDVDVSFSKNMYDKLSQMDRSVNKLKYLVFRVIRKGMKDPGVLKSLRVENCTELLDYWLVAERLEGIADDTRRIARFLKIGDFKEQEADELKKLFQITKDEYFRLMKSLYTRDVGVAHEIASAVDERLVKWDEIFNKNDKKVAGPLIERFKAIEGQVREVARVIVDRGVKGEQISD